MDKIETSKYLNLNKKDCDILNYLILNDTAKVYIQKLLANKKFKSITTECIAFEKFYKAEAYHQNFERDNPDNPYVISVSKPRLNAFKKKHLNK